MHPLHFTNLLIVVAAGLVAPLALGFFRRHRIPAIVLEIVLGIVLGPSVGLGVVSRASAAGLVAAGLLSVAISPTLALAVLRRGQPRDILRGDSPSPVMPVIAAEDRALSHVEPVTSAM